MRNNSFRKARKPQVEEVLSQKTINIKRQNPKLGLLTLIEKEEPLVFNQ